MQLRKLQLPVRVDVETTAKSDAFVPDLFELGLDGFRMVQYIYIYVYITLLFIYIYSFSRLSLRKSTMMPVACLLPTSLQARCRASQDTHKPVAGKREPCDGGNICQVFFFFGGWGGGGVGGRCAH